MIWRSLRYKNTWNCYSCVYCDRAEGRRLFTGFLGFKQIWRIFATTVQYDWIIQKVISVSLVWDDNYPSSLCELVWQQYFWNLLYLANHGNMNGLTWWSSCDKHHSHHTDLMEDDCQWWFLWLLYFTICDLDQTTWPIIRTSQRL